MRNAQKLVTDVVVQMIVKNVNLIWKNMLKIVIHGKMQDIVKKNTTITNI